MKISLAHDKGEVSVALRLFLIMISCFSLVQLIYNTFLSTFVLRATGSTDKVMIYNIILAAVQPMAMIAAVIVMRKSSAARVQQAGLVLLLLVNVYLFFRVERASENIYWISVLQSAANGFYFTVYACQYVAYTTNNNRDWAAGITSLISNALSLLFSLASSLLFRFYPGFAGYKILFAVSLLFTLISLLFSFRLALPETSDHTVYYLHAHKIYWTNRYARSSMLISFIDGMRVGVLAFFLNVLLFNMVSSEVLTGFNTFLSTLAVIAASAFYARYVCVTNRYRSARFSIIAMLASTLLLLVRMSPVTIILYSAVNSFMLPFYSTPLLNAYWTVLESLPEYRCCRAETHAAREVYYSLGRVLGIVFTMVLPSTNTGAVITLFFLIGIQYFALMLSRCILRDLDHAV